MDAAGAFLRTIETTAPQQRVRCIDTTGVGYFATVARIAHARAVNEIDPFAAIGKRSRMRSRRRSLAVSASDMT